MISNMIALWSIVAIIAIVAEIATQQLVSIWFAAGSIVSLILALCHVPTWVQIAVFVVVSLILLALTRPIAKKIYSFGIQNTNHLEVGKIGRVIQPIDAEQGTGRVRVDGVDWIAISVNGTFIEKETSVKVLSVEGSKLIVTAEGV